MAAIEKFKDIKVLEVTDDYFLGSKGYQIFKYDFLQKKYDFFANVIDGYRFLLHILYLGDFYVLK